jgi:hypothetical protein
MRSFVLAFDTSMMMDIGHRVEKNDPENSDISSLPGLKLIGPRPLSSIESTGPLASSRGASSRKTKSRKDSFQDEDVYAYPGRLDSLHGSGFTTRNSRLRGRRKRAVGTHMRMLEPSPPTTPPRSPVRLKTNESDLVELVSTPDSVYHAATIDSPKTIDTRASSSWQPRMLPNEASSSPSSTSTPISLHFPVLASSNPGGWRTNVKGETKKGVDEWEGWHGYVGQDQEDRLGGNNSCERLELQDLHGRHDIREVQRGYGLRRDPSGIATQMGWRAHVHQEGV